MEVRRGREGRVGTMAIVAVADGVVEGALEAEEVSEEVGVSGEDSGEGADMVGDGRMIYFHTGGIGSMAFGVNMFVLAADCLVSNLQYVPKYYHLGAPVSGVTFDITFVTPKSSRELNQNIITNRLEVLALLIQPDPPMNLSLQLEIAIAPYPEVLPICCCQYPLARLYLHSVTQESHSRHVAPEISGPLSLAIERRTHPWPCLVHNLFLLVLAVLSVHIHLLCLRTLHYHTHHHRYRIDVHCDLHRTLLRHEHLS